MKEEMLKVPLNLLVSKEIMDELRRINYEHRDKYSSIATFVRQAICEKLQREKNEGGI